MIKPILLNGGLVTSRHVSLLEEGELVRADDSRYRANNPALHRAWGRTKYITSNGQIAGSSGKVIGLAYCPFDPTADGTSDDFLVAHRTNKYYTSVFSARTGSFSGTTIDNVGTGFQLDSCHANNRYYLFNGNADGVANQVLKPGVGAPGSRRQGLVPVAIGPTTLTVTTSVGSWPRDETFWGEGRFFFFTTEVVGPGTADELESAANIAAPPYVDLQKDGSGNILLNVTVTRHSNLANPTTTEVRFYMVKASLNQAWNPSLLVNAFRVGTTSVSATPANDKIVLTANQTFYNPPGTPTVTVVSGSITNPNNLTVDDNNAGTVNNGNTAVVDMTNWGFALPATSIVGMKIFIRSRTPGRGAGYVDAQFRTGAGPTLGISKQLLITWDDYRWEQLPNPPSETDTWGLTLSNTDVNSSNFGIRLTITTSGSGAVKTDLSFVGIQLYTASSPSIGPAYPIVAIQEGNVLTVQSANTPPPVSSTGDVIDGALLVNNVNNGREIAYSLPLKYDYFPLIYKIAIDSKEHDTVMIIRRVGDIGLIFMKHQVYRVNYVPYSTDPEFITGRCYEAIVPDHGCISKQGVVLFIFPDGPMLAGYVSHNGVYMNDGARDHIMTEDLKWEALVDVTQLDKAVLINYPKEYVLAMHYIGAGTGATENNRYILIHYHPSHRKENGHFKITGPNKMRGACGTVAKLISENVMILGHATDARLYVEDNDVSDAEGTGINMLFETREIYPAGLGNDGTVVRTWIHQNGTAGAMTGTIMPRIRNHDTALLDIATQSFTPGVEGLLQLQTHFGLAESVRYQVSLPDAAANNADIAFNHIAHDFEDHGKALST